LAVNTLTALNLTRVFRLVFLGSPQAKTRRAPEVAWPMAVPIVVMTVMTLMVPALMQRLSLLPDWEYLNWSTIGLLVASGLIGCLLGGVVTLNRTWARPVQASLRFFQDLLAYDFYVDRLYRVSVVFMVNILSQITTWVDRYIVDGAVNLVGLASIFGGEFLKYSISGQSQFYLLTILLGVSLLGVWLTWSMW
jgi:NAD(P)H-quinone oxidoreductase subunit 5